jgi:hypothetical protein
MSWIKVAVFATFIVAAASAAVFWPTDIAVNVIIALTAFGVYLAWPFGA